MNPVKNNSKFITLTSSELGSWWTISRVDQISCVPGLLRDLLSTMLQNLTRPVAVVLISYFLTAPYFLLTLILRVSMTRILVWEDEDVIQSKISFLILSWLRTMHDKYPNPDAMRGLCKPHLRTDSTLHNAIIVRRQDIAIQLRIRNRNRAGRFFRSASGIRRLGIHIISCDAYEDTSTDACGTRAALARGSLEKKYLARRVSRERQDATTSTWCSYGNNVRVPKVRNSNNKELPCQTRWNPEIAGIS